MLNDRPGYALLSGVPECHVALGCYWSPEIRYLKDTLIELCSQGHSRHKIPRFLCCGTPKKTSLPSHALKCNLDSSTPTPLNSYHRNIRNKQPSTPFNSSFAEIPYPSPTPFPRLLPLTLIDTSRYTSMESPLFRQSTMLGLAITPLMGTMIASMFEPRLLEARLRT